MDTQTAAAAAVTGFSGLVLALSIVVALVNCFFGYKLQRMWIGLICFFAGLIGGYAITSALMHGSNAVIAVFVGIALGALLTVLSYKLYLVGVFLFAAASTLWTCLLLITEPTWLGAVVGAVLGLLIGFLAVKFTRTVMILATAIGGGLSAFKSIILLIPIAAIAGVGWLPYVGGGLLAAAGIAVQYHGDMKTRRERKAREDAKTQKAADKAAEKAARHAPAAEAPKVPTAAPRMPEPLPLETAPEAASEAAPEAAPEAPATEVSSAAEEKPQA